MLLAWAWINIARPTVDIAASLRLLEEMNVVTAALSHDLGGSMLPCSPASSSPESQPMGRLLEIQYIVGTEYDTFELHYDTDGSGTWDASLDTAVKYSVDETIEETESGNKHVIRLLRTWTHAGTSTTMVVARNLCMFRVTPNTDGYAITLGFQYSDRRWNYFTGGQARPHNIWQRTIQTPKPPAPQ